jgi:hypothetical protein
MGVKLDLWHLGADTDREDVRQSAEENIRNEEGGSYRKLEEFA